MMAREAARRSGDGTLREVRIPSSAPGVRLWDDVGAASAPAIGVTTATIGAGGSGNDTAREAGPGPRANGTMPRRPNLY
ncbi:MAG: hypothetical protein ACREFP_12605 [Acetobacteraceae bacterium]